MSVFQRWFMPQQLIAQQNWTQPDDRAWAGLSNAYLQIKIGLVDEEKLAFENDNNCSYATIVAYDARCDESLQLRPMTPILPADVIMTIWKSYQRVEA